MILAPGEDRKRPKNCIKNPLVRLPTSSSELNPFSVSRKPADRPSGNI